MSTLQKEPDDAYQRRKPTQRRQVDAVAAAAVVLRHDRGRAGDRCTAQGGGEAKGSCAIATLYEGRSYTQVANIDFTVGQALGPAEFPPCDDTPGVDDAAEPGSTTAYAIDGVNPRVAIAIRYT
ncbi:DUF6281 family protein [Streptomyces halstedii]|uniref:DUF6281 family protein n=1 Tax=Streptomyces halstedii TaxID=1944 RepID=UPI0034603B6D